ncbi:MAG: RNA polymerase sigma factor [Planctomycetota bacterium]|jgi:RNA polymerase sigma factor (sigma-70 family)
MRPRTRQNESALVCAARLGDKEALRLLLAGNWGWLKGLVYAIVHDADDVDDVLQEICVRVINKIDTLREPERFRPWLATLARRQALQYSRHKNQRPISLSPEQADEQCDEKAHQSLEDISKREQCRQILEAVKGLPEKYREVFLLEYSSDLTYSQIAEILDIPVTTMQIRLVRARRMICDKVMAKKKDRIQGK